MRTLTFNPERVAICVIGNKYDRGAILMMHNPY